MYKEYSTFFIFDHKLMLEQSSWIFQISCSHRSHGDTLPLQIGTKKRMVFSNIILCTKKDFRSSFSKNVWPFE